MLTDQEINELDLLLSLESAQACKDSLYRFTREFLDIIEPAADSFIWNWHIKELCDELQKLVFAYRDGGPTYHLNINICPGATKSTIFSRIATPWIWAVFPEATTINVSRDSNNVKEFALKSKEIINSEKYKLMFPHVRIKDEPDSMFYFENTMGGRRYGITTNSKGSTGKHGDFHFYDDVYSYVDLDSPQTISSLETSLQGLLSRFKDKSRGSIVNAMQRLGFNDATAFLFTGYKGNSPKLSNFKNICLPAEINDEVEPKELKENYIDGLLDPIRLSRDILYKERIKYGHKYDAQFEQKPLLDKEGLLYKDIIYFDHELPEGADYSFTDVADGGDDYLATWFVRASHEGLFVYDAIYTKDGSKITIPRLEKELLLRRCVINWFESNNQGSVFISTLEKTVPNVFGRFESQKKESRLNDYAHFTKNIKFKNTGSSEYLKAIDHLKHIPKKIPNSGRGMDIDSADALTAMMRYFYSNYPEYFLNN